MVNIEGLDRSKVLQALYRYALPQGMGFLHYTPEPMTDEEAEHSPLKHVLTRNLGSSDDLEAEIYEIEPASNDRFILCSDGLTDLVSDDEILKVAIVEDNPEALCRKFIDMALTRGAHDNTTVVSVYLTDPEKHKSGPVQKIGGLFTR